MAAMLEILNKEVVYLGETKFIFMQIFFTVLYLQLDRHENPLNTKLDSLNLYYLEVDNAWFNSTCYHPPPGHTPGHLCT